jgi:hypothetical protein
MWGFNCPTTMQKKDSQFSECIRYEEWEHVSDGGGSASERKEQVPG